MFIVLICFDSHSSILQKNSSQTGLHQIAFPNSMAMLRYFAMAGLVCVRGDGPEQLRIHCDAASGGEAGEAGCWLTSNWPFWCITFDTNRHKHIYHGEYCIHVYTILNMFWCIQCIPYCIPNISQKTYSKRYAIEVLRKQA